MLELRPICEHCARQLPPHSTEARICSFECTFCRACAEGVFMNVCPNCGGGFERRPVRPQGNHRSNNNLENYPAISSEKHKPKNIDEHRSWAKAVSLIPPGDR